MSLLQLQCLSIVQQLILLISSSSYLVAGFDSQSDPLMWSSRCPDLAWSGPPALPSAALATSAAAADLPWHSCAGPRCGCHASLFLRQPCFCPGPPGLRCCPSSCRVPIPGDSPGRRISCTLLHCPAHTSWCAVALRMAPFSPSPFSLL